MAKTFKITIDKRRWELIGADIYLTDGPGAFNRPVVVARFSAGTAYTDCSVGFTFQRHLYSADDPDSRWAKPALGDLDTARPWTECYGGEVALSSSGKMTVRDVEPKLSAEDRLRVAVTRKIARTIDEYNIARVHSCEATRVIEAFYKLGATVGWHYVNGREEYNGRWEAKDHGIQLGANQRELDAKRGARVHVVAEEQVS